MRGFIVRVPFTRGCIVILQTLAYQVTHEDEVVGVGELGVVLARVLPLGAAGSGHQGSRVLCTLVAAIYSTSVSITK